MEEPRHRRSILVHHGTMMDSAGLVRSKNGHGLEGRKASRMYSTRADG